jgi:holo-ACP synthase/triphosphoribosyl-dephospho-CoA synthase
MYRAPKAMLVNAFFRYCLGDLQYYLNSHQVKINVQDAVQQTDEAGDFFLAAFSPGTHSVGDTKQICEDFEEHHPFGRFIDVDLTDIQGLPVSSGKTKKCFYCGQKPAIECRRDNRHDLNELRAFMFSGMRKFCLRQREEDICRKISSMALRSILYEVSVTPKPGLVDRFNNGSHTDMNFRPLSIQRCYFSYFADLVDAV